MPPLLLWRLRLRDVDVGSRWTDLADTYEPMAEDGYYAFNDMHAVMAFTSCGRSDATARLLRALDEQACGQNSNAMMTREVWASGVPGDRRL